MHTVPETLTRDEFRQFAEFVYREAGISLADYKIGLLSNRLRARVRARGFASFAEYYSKLHDTAFRNDELPFFLSAVTTNETYFFRNERLWELFERQIIPEIAARAKMTRRVRIWSAASSSGEEAYSAAILLKERLPEPRRWDIAIIGSDISVRVLEKARTGLYNDYAVSRTSPERIARWFEREGDAFRVKEEIRELVTFRSHNLRDRFPGPPFDFVLLRNVLMYFDTAMKKSAVQTATDAVAPGGYLYVGDVDPLRTTRDLAGAMRLQPGVPGLYHRPATAPAEAQEYA